MLTLDLVHESEGHILVVNVKNDAGPSLVDSLGEIYFHELIVDLISIPGVVLIHQVEEVPSEENALSEVLGLPESHELLVQKVSNVQVNAPCHALLLHVLSN
jgi:hypothetical protein